MRLKLPNLSKSTAALDDILPFSRTVIIRRPPKPAAPPNCPIVSCAPPSVPTPPKPPRKPPGPPPPPIDAARPEYRENEMHIQMLSRSLYAQIFGSSAPPNGAASLDAATAERFRDNLQRHGIRPGDSAPVADISERLRLPRLHGRTLEAHFERIADQQARPYRRLAERLAAMPVPAMPAVWRLQAGWTHYCARTGAATAVPYPDDDGLVFDIENCVREGAAPTLACALGESGWYSWVSQPIRRLIHTTRPRIAP